MEKKKKGKKERKREKEKRGREGKGRSSSHLFQKGTRGGALGSLLILKTGRVSGK